MMSDRKSSFYLRLTRILTRLLPNKKMNRMHQFWLILVLPFRFLLVAVEDVWCNYLELKRMEKFKVRLEKMRSESKNMDSENLSEKYQIEIAEYYEEVLEENKRKLELMTSENSLQLIYQLTILLYEYKVKHSDFNKFLIMFSTLRFMN